MHIDPQDHTIVSKGIPPSTEASMEFAAESVYLNKDKWINTSIDERLAILDEIREGIKAVLPLWVNFTHRAKQLRSDDFMGQAEEWVFGAILYRQINQLKRSLQEIRQHDQPQPAAAFYERPNGQVAVPIFPRSTSDRFVFGGVSAEIWFNPNYTRQQIIDGMAAAYKNQAQEGKVTLILGAGNVSLLVPGDFLYKLFVENRVVVLKMNPANEYLGPLIERAYAPLVQRGFLRVVYGGPEQAAYLINHPYIDELHITGSQKTFEDIVFGRGKDAARRKNGRNPRMTKRFTAELGNICPVIVVPGPWTQKDIEYQARVLATHLVVNAGFNCVTPRLVVQHEGWNLRGAFNQVVNQQLSRIPSRAAYYPGALERFSQFQTAYPGANLHGTNSGSNRPWLYVTGIDASNENELAFTTEAFCGVLTETAIHADTVSDYLDRAVEFLNQNVWGTLVVTLLVHPASLRNPDEKAAVERAVENLRYGTVGVNVYGTFAYAALITAWGGHSGHDIYDIQSGTGFVNNMLMFDEAHIQKSVYRDSFRSILKNIDPTASNLLQLAHKIAQFEGQPSFRSAAEVALAFLNPYNPA